MPKGHRRGKRSEDEARDNQCKSRVIAEEGMVKRVSSQAKPHRRDQIIDKSLRLHQDSHHSHCHHLERGRIRDHKKQK